jgi:hypothetical protein
MCKIEAPFLVQKLKMDFAISNFRKAALKSKLKKTTK